MDNSGTDNLYPTWTSFIPIETQNHYGLYILNGTNPSLQVEWKFRTNEIDNTHGNYFSIVHFGKMLSVFIISTNIFPLQDPVKEDPPIKKSLPENQAIAWFFCNFIFERMDFWEELRSG